MWGYQNHEHAKVLRGPVQLRVSRRGHCVAAVRDVAGRAVIAMPRSLIPPGFISWSGTRRRRKEERDPGYSTQPTELTDDDGLTVLTDDDGVTDMVDDL
jgi:hypothetical protein